MRLLTAVLALSVLGLTACGGDDEDDDASPDDRLAEAADVLPAGTTRLDFVDRAASAERAGVGGTDVSVDEYLETQVVTDIAGSPLATALLTGRDSGVALDERGVLWAATIGFEGTDGNGTATVYSVADDVDLDAMAAELEDAGMAAEESEGRTHLEGTPSELVDITTNTIAGGYPATFYDVTVDPEARLVVTGADAEEVFLVVDGDKTSLADGPLGEILDGVESNDTVRVEALPDCLRVLGPQATPEQLEQLDAEAPDFQQPLQTLLLQGVGDPQVRLLMADEDAAAADAEVRQTFLDEGTLLSTGDPVADVLSAKVTNDGKVVVVDATIADDTPVDILDRLAETSDGPFACY